MSSATDEELYRKNIDTRLKPVVKTILKSGFGYIDSWDSIQISAALHHYLSKRINYKSRGCSPNRRRFRPPTETWKKGGNCEEQSVFIASLYGCVKGVESKLVSVGNEDGNFHLLPLAGYNLSSGGVQTRLERFYQKDLNFDRSFDSGMNWVKSEGLIWFFADTEYSNYIGDIENLKRDGYVVDVSDGWKWNNKRYEIRI